MSLDPSGLRSVFLPLHKNTNHAPLLVRILIQYTYTYIYHYLSVFTTYKHTHSPLSNPNLSAKSLLHFDHKNCYNETINLPKSISLGKLKKEKKKGCCWVTLKKEEEQDPKKK